MRQSDANLPGPRPIGINEKRPERPNDYFIAVRAENHQIEFGRAGQDHLDTRWNCNEPPGCPGGTEKLPWKRICHHPLDRVPGGGF